MQIRLLHAIASGIIIALVLGFSLIPTMWQMINQEPTFGPTCNDIAIIVIIASITVVAITLLSFKLVRRTEE